MIRKNLATSKFETNRKVDKFLEDILRMYKKHGMALDFKDKNIIVKEENIELVNKIKHAFIEMEEKKKNDSSSIRMRFFKKKEN